MRILTSGICLLGLGAALTGCGEPASTNTTHIEAMGPDGGSNLTTTPSGNAAGTPVGSADNGNVAPGDANPAEPRNGSGSEAGNSQ